ncbi:chaperonin Cpn10 family protein [Tieghemostelium lacteum]|uniref:Chaperonin Cpn10 family protein n=1 Tax=Tieghemostelium lacteum TaxID=361077 RepID=A0A151Z9J0_TIELA|nr:chaperonin Cpn10 family protein [Tieghemostelium lacteum]|eukprot:KYQ90534.1 chaperonin Cpn10 family protein [Tieghemostelium lacteum]
MSSIKSFKPLFDRVLVQRLAKSGDVKTQGGIYLPEKVQSKINEGLILEVGTGRRVGNDFAPPLLKKGDRVLLKDVSGEKINVNGIDCEILVESEILGLMN